MPCIKIKAIYILVTCDCSFKGAVGTLGYLVVFIKIQAYNWEFNL